MKFVHKRQEVIFDLAAIYHWIGERNIEAAERFLEAVDFTFNQIRKMPGIGWERVWRSSKLRGMRSWRVEGFPNFLVFYREEQMTIEIYAVMRASRDLERHIRKR